MNVEELADHWDAEAAHNDQRAEDCRSIDAHVRYQAQAQQLRWCAAQLRLVTQPPVVVRFNGTLGAEQVDAFKAELSDAIRNRSGRTA